MLLTYKYAGCINDQWCALYKVLPLKHLTDYTALVSTYSWIEMKLYLAYLVQFKICYVHTNLFIQTVVAFLYMHIYNNNYVLQFIIP